MEVLQAMTDTDKLGDEQLIAQGMTVAVGRLRPCPLLGLKFVVLGHNTIRGAAGGAVHNAELLAAQRWLS